MKPVRPLNASAIHAPRGSAPFELPRGFAPDAPIDLEIGCGQGLHPIRYAQANPDRFLIAIEHTSEKFARFRSRLDHHPQIRNLLAVHAEGVAWTTHCLPSARISRCFFMYPNPNPKSESKRWIRMPYFHRLLELMKPEGEITFASNIESYIEEVRAYATGFWGLTLAEDFSFGQDGVPGGRPRTHFEKKYLERGEICHQLTLKLSPKSRL